MLYRRHTLAQSAIPGSKPRPPSSGVGGGGGAGPGDQTLVEAPVSHDPTTQPPCLRSAPPKHLHPQSGPCNTSSLSTCVVAFIRQEVSPPPPQPRHPSSVPLRLLLGSFAVNRHRKYIFPPLTPLLSPTPTLSYTHLRIP